MKNLGCSRNQLSSLDVSANNNLNELWCDNGQLTSLDLSNHKMLTDLWCYNNQLTSLNVSNNTALTSLSCLNNQLTALDLRTNTALVYLWCYNNPNLKTVCLDPIQMKLTNNIKTVLEKDPSCSWSLTDCGTLPPDSNKLFIKPKQ